MISKNLIIAFSFLTSSVAFAGKPVREDTQTTGNGGTVGSSKAYQLNIIGIKSNNGRLSKSELKAINDQLDSQKINNGRRIFVLIDGNTRIGLSEGDFQVLDHDGTDGRASFQLPSPGEYSGETGTVSTYSVESRILGKQGGSIDITPCADVAFEDTTEVVCSEQSLVEVREGQSKFTNVTSELLYLHTDTDGNGKTEAYPLFSQELAENMGAESAEYFWDVNTNVSFKLLQLRFFHYDTQIN